MFKIVKKKVLNPTVSQIVVEAPYIAKKAEPGQFIILRIDEQGERIPFTIADFERGRLFARFCRSARRCIAL